MKDVYETLKNNLFNNKDLKGKDFEGTTFESCNIDNTKLDIEGFVAYGTTRGFSVT